MNKQNRVKRQIVILFTVATFALGSLFALPVDGVSHGAGQDVAARAIAKNSVAAKIKNYGGSKVEGFASVTKSPDGGYVAVGSANSSSGTGSDLPGNKGGDDMIIAKFDMNGNMAWLKNFGGSGADLFECVIQSHDGGYVVVGGSSSPAGLGSDLPGNKGDEDMIIAKFDANGNKVWMKNYGGSGSERFFSVVKRDNGGYMAVGYSNSAAGAGSDLPGNKGSYDMVVAQFDENGNKYWMQNYGGSQEDAFRSIIKSPEQWGGYVAVGYSQSPAGNGSDLPGNKGAEDMVVAKFDASGQKVWLGTCGGSRSERLVSVVGEYYLNAPMYGYYVAVGYSNSTAGTGSDLPGNKGSNDMVIAKFTMNGYTKQGEMNWIKNYGGNRAESFSSVISSPGGGYVAVGETSSSAGTGSDLPWNYGGIDMAIAKFDANGNKVWMKNYGGGKSDYFQAVASSPGGGFVAFGRSNSLADAESELMGNKGNFDMALAKINDAGNLSDIPWMNNQAAPSAPVLARKSPYSISLTVQSTAQEYSRDASRWQSSPTFDELKPNTSYTFYQRYKAKAGYNASPASPGLTVKTDPAPKTGTKFKVTFNPNWGKLKITKAWKTKWKNYFSPKPAVKTVAYGKAYGSLPGIKKQPPGYKFAGWWTAASGGRQITSKSKVSTGMDATLYAHWTARWYTVKFVNAKGKVVKKKKVAYGKKYGKLPTGEAKGWEFLGWYTKKAGGKRITAKSVVTITANSTLYPHWKKA